MTPLARWCGAAIALLGAVPGWTDAATTGDPEVAPVFESFFVEPRPGLSRAAAEDYVKRAVRAVLGEACAADAREDAHCWRARPFTVGSPDFEVTRPEPALDPARAWELAYALRDQEGIEEAEPLFAVDVEDWSAQFVPADAREDRRENLGAQFKCDHAPEALAEPEWSLGPQGADVIAAWALVKQKWERLSGRPYDQHPALLAGRGVRVFHPDTGYTKHPELFPGQLELGAGKDFVKKDGDPLDELEGGLLSKVPGLREPGHGTKTGSVIVSAPGQQLTGAEGFVTGVAPGAHLIPLRAYKGILLVSMGNLAKAITYATDQGAEVISISMGGPLGSGALHKAIRTATDRGVIVLAASGNVVPFVVFPARYPETISVAASNVKQEVWKASSHGKRVDISAPGQSVWRASAENRQGTPSYSNSVGCGTSFAVATTAGVAALWLDYRREDLVPYRGSPYVASLFRGILRTRGHRTPAGWPAADYGPGIVDAVKVLEAPIAAPDASGRPVEAGGGIALEGVSVKPAELACPPELHARLASILPAFDAESPAALKARLATLLRTSPEGVCAALADVGGEIAFQYAFNRSVREAIDGHPAGQPGSSLLEAAGPSPRTVLLAHPLSGRLRERIATP